MTATFIPNRAAQLDALRDSQIRFDQIDAQQADITAAQTAKNMQEHYRKYPWTNPGLTVAFGKWKTQFGPKIAKQLSRTASGAIESGEDPSAALEEFAMTKEFSRLLKSGMERFYSGYYQQHPERPVPTQFAKAADRYTRQNPIEEGNPIGDIVALNPILSAVRGGFEGAKPGEIATGLATNALQGPGAPFTQELARGASAVNEAVDIPSPVKAPLRVGFTALASPYEEVQGQAMAALTGLVGPIGNQAQPAPPGSAASRLGAVSGSPETQPLSTGGIALERVINGEPVDLGEGIFPAGDIKAERDRRLREIASLTYKGQFDVKAQEHFLTPGRTLGLGLNQAFGITEPGTIPFEAISGAADAASIIRLDPANLALAAGGAALRGSKTFNLTAAREEAGAFQSWRKWGDGPTFDRWGDGPKGSRFFNWTAGLDPDTGFHEFMVRTNFKFAPDDALKMVRQSDPAEVRRLMEPIVSSGRLAEVPNPWATSANIRQLTTTKRWAGLRPWRDIDTRRMGGETGALNAVVQHMKNSRVDEQTISKAMVEMVDNRSQFGMNEGLKVAFRTIEEEMVANGIPRSEAKTATTIWHNDLAEGSLYHIDAVAHDATAPGVMIGGELLPYDNPHTWIQAMDSKVWLPDPREVDKLYARYGRVLGMHGTGLSEAERAARDAEGLPDTALALTEKGLSQAKYGAWVGKTALTNIQSKFWVPINLLRGAWTVRIVADEMLRSAMAGNDSINHPLRMIGWILSQKNPTEAKLLASMEGQAALSRDIGIFMGDPNASVANAFRNNQGANLVAKGRDIIQVGDPDHGRWWANSLIESHTDPVTKSVARALYDGTPIEDIKTSFREGSLSTFRKDMMEQPGLKRVLEAPAGPEAYIDHLVNEIHGVTGSDRDLIGYIASGKYGDEAAQATGRVSLAGRHAIDEGLDPSLEGLIVEHKGGSETARVYFPGADESTEIPVANLTLTDTAPVIAQTMARDGVRVDKDFVAYLDSLPDDIKPQNVIGTRVLTEQQRSLYDRTVRRFFVGLMDIPSNTLNRQRDFRQLRWQRVEQMMPHTDPKSQQLFIAEVNAGTGLARIPKTTRDAIKNAAKLGSGELSYSEVDELSKGYALDGVNDLLYQLNRRGQFFDATRLLFPFGEAWKEIYTAWGRILREHPETIRKAQVAITELREVNPFTLIPGAYPDVKWKDPDTGEWTNYRDQGFFYTDPRHGNEMFGYPFSHWINQATGNGPVPFKGSVQGLSLGLSLTPGIGPVAAFGANFLMDKFMSDPKYDDIRSFIFPYGEPDYGLGLEFGPAWAQKWLTSFGETKESSRLLNETAIKILMYRYSTGEEDPTKEAELDPAFQRAYEAAQIFYRVQGTFQWGAPSAPSPEFVAESKKGLVLLSTLRDEAFQMQQDDFDGWVAKFIKRYGEKAFWATGAFTINGAYALPFTKQQTRWARNNPDVVKEFPLIYGYFAPPGNPKDFDSDARLRYIERGQLDPLVGADWTRQVNNTLGWFELDKYMRDELNIGPNDTPNAEGRRLIREKKDEIHDRRPGFDDIDHRNINKRIHAIEQLTAAAKDPKLQKQRPALTKAISDWIEERDAAIKAVRESGGAVTWNNPGYREADKYRFIRAELRRQGEKILKRTPAFKNVWEQVFEPDIGEDPG